MKLTLSQAQAVNHRGSNLLVCASAGSGKTEVLTQRVVALVADPQQPVDITRLLVVTFTRAAAAELRVRTGRLLRELADQEKNPSRREHLRRQHLLLDSADIGTIDAWCSRIVRAHAEQVGIDPNFSVVGEEESVLLRAQVLEELIHWLCSAPDPLAQRARDFLACQPRPDDRILRNVISRLHAAREHLIDPQTWLRRQRAEHRGTDAELRQRACQQLSRMLHQDLLSLAEELGALWAYWPALRATLGTLAQTVKRWCDELAATPHDEAALVRTVNELAALRRCDRRQTDAVQCRVEHVHRHWLARVQRRWSAEVIQTVLDTAPAAAGWLSLLIDLEELYDQRLGQTKRARAVCEFADVLRLALELLGTRMPDGGLQPSPIAARYAAHYEHILVDEYQDTSPVQVELLRLVSRRQPGNRFLVGDLKQSIYGFRQAEPRLFAALIDDFSSGRQEGRVHYLSDNFRSHRQLLEGLNRLFGLLFHRRLGGTGFGPAERLHAARAEIPNPTLDQQPRIEIRLFEAQPSRQTSADTSGVPLERLEREAIVAARVIRELLQKTQIPQRNFDGSLTLRPLRLSDIVVLLRSARYNAATVARVLRQEGLPCTTAGREAWAEAPEVRDVRNVLTLLVNRRQDVPLAAYLRSPMVGLSAAELLRIRRLCPRGDFYRAVRRFTEQADPAPEDRELVSKLRAAWAQLDHWRMLAFQEELPDLLRRIYNETGYLLFVEALPLGQHRAALLRALQNLAADFAHSGQHGLAEFDAWLEELAAAELDPGTPVVAGEDVIRIMTIHAAKGLEFPVVFLLNCGARFNPASQREPLQFDPDVGLGLRVWDWPSRRRVETAGWSAARDAVAARELEEELRLLYVATTRAREKLFIFGHAPQGTWRRMQDHYGNCPPPLADRLAVTSPLEWLLMAAACALQSPSPKGEPALATLTVLPPEEVAKITSAQPAPAAQVPEAAEPHVADDQSWVDQSRRLMSFQPDRSLARLPAVISVTTAVELTRLADQAQRPHTVSGTAPELSLPAFKLTAERAAGRQRGIACHRFLQLADPACLADPALLRREVERLVAAGRLTAADAELIPTDSLLWFGTTAPAELMRRHRDRLRREVAFVYAWPIGPAQPTGGNNQPEEYTLIRGIIDCLMELDDGLTILDFKTDEPADAEVLQDKVQNYSIQLQLYAEAAGKIFARPVRQASLVFLTLRQIIDVGIGTPPALDELLTALERIR